MEFPVTIQSNSRELYGIYHECKDSKGTILFCHGLGGTRVDVHRITVLFCRELEKHGYSSLRVDFTGSGISQGRFLDFTFPQMYEDLGNMINWLKVNKEVDNLYLLGFSDGAVITFNTGLVNEVVKGLIFWSPNFTTKKNTAHGENGVMSSRLHKVEGQLAWSLLGHWLYKDYFSDREKAVAQVDFNAITQKSLIIYGEKDAGVKAIVEEFESLGLEKIEIQGADHLFFAPIWVEQVIDNTINWLKENV